jgi:integron integrase
MTAKQQQQKADMVRLCRDKIRVKHLALATERTYLSHIGSYIDWLAEHGREMPDTRARIEAFLTRIGHRGCAAATQNQAFNALLFLYEQALGQQMPDDIQALRAKRPQQHRTDLPRETTIALLDTVQDQSGYPTRLVCWLLYGAGLRVSEPLNLRVKDLDLLRGKLCIRGAKGGKDRTVDIPTSLRPALETQLRSARAIWETDARDGIPVELPSQLARKYRRAPYAWQWAWVFPSRTVCQHPRTGETVRYRMHEANVQRAMRTAAQKLGLDGLATPHILRHCWASHVLAAGENIRAVQEQLGHKSLETTMIYVHARGAEVRSPLDRLPTNVLPFPTQSHAASSARIASETPGKARA